jgi:hypothetical protein
MLAEKSVMLDLYLGLRVDEQVSREAWTSMRDGECAVLRNEQRA